MATQAKGSSQTQAFDQALESFESVMKSCIQLQEQVAQTSTRMLSEMGSPQDMQERAKAALDDAVPAMRKSMDEAMQTINDNAKTSLDLLEKAMSAGRSASVEEAQQRTRELWESMLTTARTNSTAMVQMNARAIDAWAQLARKSAPAEPAKK